MGAGGLAKIIYAALPGYTFSAVPPIALTPANRKYRCVGSSMPPESLSWHSWCQPLPKIA